MADLYHTLTNDILFKMVMVFLRLPERLKDIIARSIDIPFSDSNLGIKK
jgi:hypothetical protein